MSKFRKIMVHGPEKRASHEDWFSALEQDIRGKDRKPFEATQVALQVSVSSLSSVTNLPGFLSTTERALRHLNILTPQHIIIEGSVYWSEDSRDCVTITLRGNPSEAVNDDDYT